MSQKEFIDIIKKYSTIELIKYCSQLSVEMYDSKEPFRMETLPYYYRNGIKAGTCDFIYAQHELINLIYLSILYGNDYKKLIMDKNGFVNTLDKLRKYKNELSKKDKNVAKYHLELFAILFNEQIEFQKINHSINRFNRICYIFDIINKKYDNHPEYINFEEEIQEITGMTLKEYNELNLFITLIVVGSKNIDLTNIVNKMDLNLEKFSFNKEDLIKFLNDNSKDYNYYRKADNKTENWNILKYAPLVKTDKDGHVYVSNIYSFIISFSTKIYWLLRDKYKKQNSQKFTNYFGYCFEMYLKELFDFYDIDNYKKIEENKTEQPDWTIETEDYNIIIEQKSSLFSIGSRETTLDNKYDEINKFVKKIRKAMSQLSKYSISNNKKTLRMCLTFEKVDGIEPIQELALKELNIDNKELYWLINISDFEILIYLLKNDYNKFKSTIEKKIKLEITNDKNGRSFEKILSEDNKYIQDNKYIHDNLDYFRKLSNEIITKIK